MGESRARPCRRTVGVLGAVGTVIVGTMLTPVEAGAGPGPVGQDGPDEPYATITELAPLPGSEPGTIAVPNDINDRGEIVGASQLGSESGFGSPALPTRQSATLWRDGQARALPVREGDALTSATRLNDRGQATVEARAADGARSYYFVSHGRTADLPSDLGHVFALNERGEVLMGTTELYPSASPAAGVWRRGQVRPIVPPDGAAVISLTPHSLSDRGHVAVDFSTGYLQWGVPPIPRRDLGAFVWRGGTGTLLGARGAATAANDAGQVVGFADLLGREGVVWDGDQVIRVPGFRPMDVNDRGQVVGTLLTSATAHVGLWDDGVLVDLGSLGGSSMTPYAINERGQVLALGGTPEGASEGLHLAVWTSGHWVDLGRWAPRPGGPDMNDQGQVVAVIREEVPDGPDVDKGILAQIHDPALDAAG
jgi:probable HAF family extracellular repeat protein